VLVAESYGGRDEPVDQLVASLVDVGCEVVLAPLRVKDLPSQALYQQFEEAGTDLAQALVQKEVRRRGRGQLPRTSCRGRCPGQCARCAPAHAAALAAHRARPQQRPPAPTTPPPPHRPTSPPHPPQVLAHRKEAMPAAVAKSLARLSSGLYVVSAAHNNARSAMVASWVSQASFEPLGLTVAVAKDRAIESMMQVGEGGGVAGWRATGGGGGVAGCAWGCCRC
jgi:hypothetical protein